MTLAIFINSLAYGGAEKQAILDANMLSDYHSVFLLYFKEGPLLDLIGSKVQAVQLKKSNYLSTAYRLKRMIDLHHIEFVHASLFAAMVISALAALISKVNVFWHVHSHEYDIPLIARWTLKVLAKSPHVKKILFVSAELKLFYVNAAFNFPIQKSDIIYNATSFLEKYGGGKNGEGYLTIGYIGRLVALKRVHLLVEMAEYLINNDFNLFRVLIIGDGEERQRLESLSIQKNLSSYIGFTGFQSDLPLYYSRFDIFVLPSEEECLPMVLIDACAFAIPSVAFHTGGNAEIVKNESSGYIVETKEQFFEKVFSLSRNENLRIQMGKMARKICRDKFSMEKRKENLDIFMDSVVKV